MSSDGAKRYGTEDTRGQVRGLNDEVHKVLRGGTASSLTPYITQMEPGTSHTDRVVACYSSPRPEML